jgi:hypothetical protein
MELKRAEVVCVLRDMASLPLTPRSPGAGAGAGAGQAEVAALERLVAQVEGGALRAGMSPVATPTNPNVNTNANSNCDEVTNKLKL